MSVTLTRQQFVYDAGGILTPLMHEPISVERAPTSQDFALPGQIWLDKPNNIIYMLASVTANSANWTAIPGSGTGIFTSLIVNAGNVSINGGNVTLTTGNVHLDSGDLSVGGTAQIDGDLTTSGEVNMICGGLINIEPLTDTQASPTTTSVLDVRFGSATFTGFTTAPTATEVFTITNSLVDTFSPIGAWACNEGSANAQMTVTRVKRSTGSFEVTLTNYGDDPLDGDVTITFLVGAFV